MSPIVHKQVLGCSMEQLRKAILNCDQHVGRLDGVVSSKIIERKLNEVVAEIHFNIIIDFMYVIRLIDKGTMIEFSIVKGDIFERMQGSWLLVPRGELEVEATYTLDIEFKLKVPQPIKNKLIAQDLKNLMLQFESWAKTL